MARIMNKKELLAQTRQALLKIAGELGIKGRTRMKKAQLTEAIVKAGTMKRETGRKKVPDRSAPTTSRKKRRRKPVREKSQVRRSWREQQSAVQHAKYEAKASTEFQAARPQGERPAPAPMRDLPASYEEDRIVLLVRDPYWIHAYWDISRRKLLEAKAEFGDEWDSVRSILRVYDVTEVDFDGTNAHSYFDVDIGGGATNWYINSRVPNRTYCVDIGLISPSGRFLVLARSNRATTPRDVPSSETDEEYMVPDWEFEKIYALSGGLTFNSGSGSVELKELIEKALAVEIGSGAPGSLGIASPVRRKAKGRAFWFRVGTELIVYGATEPDARVTVQGREIKLRPDGTFTLRFALPDGRQVIPATAESADGEESITITSTVEKRTGDSD
jgi:hypothetical protein